MFPKCYFLISLVGLTLAEFQQFPVEYSFLVLSQQHYRKHFKTFCKILEELQVELKTGNYKTLGSISIERTYDGNYTGNFHPKVDLNSLWLEMRDAAREGLHYRIRSGTDKNVVEACNEPCLMLRTGMAHQFRATIDTDQHTLLSLSVFPEGLYTAGTEYQKCTGEEHPMGHVLRGSVTVTKVGVLPAPDTESYIQKMEKERQSRQHGAQQDNRSWIQKYWMYIAAAFVFMVIMNASAGDQGES